MTNVEHVSLELTIDTGNAGVTDSPREAVGDILRTVADGVRFCPVDGRNDPHRVRDINGNTVGMWRLVFTTGDDDGE